MNKQNFRRTGRLLLLLLLTYIMTGCGSNAALENYKANMNQFFENLKIFHSSINAIDPNSESASSELLALLDSMDTSFAQMASLEVPDSFPGVAELATEASENMSQAVSFYHQAYEADPYDANLASVAYQYYERANVRVQYIISILHGDIPEEIYTYEDSSSDGGASEEESGRQDEPSEAEPDGQDEPSEAEPDGQDEPSEEE